MDLSWPHPPHPSGNGALPKDMFMARLKKMHLPTLHNLACLIWQAGRCTFLYSTDISQAYRQLSLDPSDWLLVCFTVEGRTLTNISLPLSLRWAASHCQDITGLVARELGRKGLSILHYIDNCGCLASTKAEASHLPTQLQELLACLGLTEA